MCVRSRARRGSVPRAGTSSRAGRPAGATLTHNSWELIHRDLFIMGFISSVTWAQVLVYQPATSRLAQGQASLWQHVLRVV